MPGINNFIGIGKLDIKYLIYLISSFLLLLIGRRVYEFWYFDIKNEGRPQNEKQDNILLKSLLKFLGFSIFIFGEIIRKKIYFKKRGEQRLTLIKIKNSENYKINYKDMLFIGLVNLVCLIDDFLAITIKLIVKQAKLTIDELFSSIVFILLFLTSLLIFKIKYYKHQYLSIIIIILFEIIRYFIKPHVYDLKFLVTVFLHIIRTFLTSIFIGYTRGLMEYKFFSPYKALYIFGFPNVLILIIIYFIVSYIPCQHMDMCSFNYKGKTYFDNIYSIFEGSGFIEYIAMFVYIISQGALQLFRNMIVNDFTICHIVFYLLIYAFYNTAKDKDIKGAVFFVEIILFIFEVIFLLVFLEMIELKFCGINKNLKSNIEERAKLEMKEIDSSKYNNDKKNDKVDINDDYAINFGDNQKEDDSPFINE